MPIVPLTRDHNLDAFDCGIESLNIYLKQYARQKSKRDLDRTYVLIENEEIVGYYTISSSELIDQIPGNVPRRVGVALLGRIAVDQRYQRRGLGDELLLDALRQAQILSDIAGTHAVYLDVDPANPGVKQWYLERGFQEIPNNPTRLFLRISSIRELNLLEDN